MANPVIYNVTANTSLGTAAQILGSTKVKIAANVHVYIAVGNVSTVRATTSNCQIIPPNVITTINCGPGVLTYSNVSARASDGNGIVWSTQAIASGTGPYISFLSAGPGPAQISFTEIGSINFNNTPY